MAEFIEPSELIEGFLRGDQFLDVRAESEFSKSAAPGAWNIPLLRDSERAAVGTTYKRAGQGAAIALGYDLIDPDQKALRVSEWGRAVSERKIGALYCARGGLRSEISQRWLAESGVSLPRVRDGYKGIRNLFLRELERLCSTAEFVLLTGKTGTGKTRLLSELKRTHPVVDIEECAKHRGSTFGDVYGGQPTAGNFENTLILELLRAERRGGRIILEAESRKTGWCCLPQVLWERMVSSPVILLEEPLERRIEILLEDYVLFLTERFRREAPAEFLSRLEEFLATAVQKNEKRLGGERTNRLLQLIREAVATQRIAGVVSEHRNWIEVLLTEYYDSFYERHIAECAERIECRGDAESLLRSFGSQSNRES